MEALIGLIIWFVCGPLLMVALLWGEGAIGKEPKAAIRRWKSSRNCGVDMGIPPEWFGEGP